MRVRVMIASLNLTIASEEKVTAVEVDGVPHALR